MPSSNLWLAPHLIYSLAGTIPPEERRAILDVGPGHGKYGLLAREYLKPRRLDAAEAEPRYLEAFPWLRAIYDHVMPEKVELLYRNTLERYDLVFMLDVLEHLDRDTATALLARIPGRVLIATPRDFFQNPEADQGWETERHRSVWTLEELYTIRPLEVARTDLLVDGIGAVVALTAPLP